MQGGVSASRLKLGGAWQAAFLRAPIWRFWLGAELCGTTVAGAFMPSVDGVGRYFPLTLFACADGGAPIPPPEFESQDTWFENVEQLLLSALEEIPAYEKFAAAVDAIEPPSTLNPQAAVEGLVRVGGTAVVPATPDSLRQVLAAVRAQDHERAYGAATFWWTAGGEDLRPLAVIATRMPHPHLFTGMLTGSFEGIIL
jgi:type VI secretion system protein ImpM